MSSLKPHVPVGGRLKYFLPSWRKLTSDESVLQIVRGMHLDFSSCPTQSKFPTEIIFKPDEVRAASEHIEQLLAKKAIKECFFPDGFISNVFLTPKHDGGFRMILNLKSFNKFVHYEHFKMESFQQILDSIVQGCYMSVLDLTDAYLTIPVSPEFIKYLQFAFRGRIFCYLCMPFGLSSAPRKFTKLLRPVVCFLREKGIILVIYIDDIWISAMTFRACKSSMLQTAHLLNDLGFLINRKKSKPVPAQKVTVLGYIVDSVKMIVSLPIAKQKDIRARALNLLNSKAVSIRCVATFIGKVVACFPACPLARAHYRYLEWDKIKALCESSFDYDASCKLSTEARSDISWIFNHILGMTAPIKSPPVTIELFVDASKYGWGATLSQYST